MPLSPIEIKVELMRRGAVKLTDLARKWKGENPHLHITEQVLSRVINRREPYVYPEVRELLAAYLEVPVSEVGREPQPRTVADANVESQLEEATAA